MKINRHPLARTTIEDVTYRTYPCVTCAPHVRPGGPCMIRVRRAASGVRALSASLAGAGVIRFSPALAPYVFHPGKTVMLCLKTSHTLS